MGVCISRTGAEPQSQPQRVATKQSVSNPGTGANETVTTVEAAFPTSKASGESIASAYSTHSSCRTPRAEAQGATSTSEGTLSVSGAAQASSHAASLANSRNNGSKGHEESRIQASQTPLLSSSTTTPSPLSVESGPAPVQETSVQALPPNTSTMRPASATLEPLKIQLSDRVSVTEAAKEVWVVRKTQNLKEVYEFGQKLGKGNYGVTHVVTHIASGEKYCCKSMNKTEAQTEEDLQDMRKEVELMFLLSGNPHVVTLFEVYEDPTHVHLIMEYCTGGDLFERVVKKGYYTERDAATIVRHILTAIAHCHSMGVIHRDIKPENFLIASSDPDALVKVTDFGLSTFFREGQVFRQIVGSPFYIAPEVLKKSYSKEADIWSVGVVLYILLSGVPPFYGDTEEEVFKAILKDSLDFNFAPWPRISREAKDCVERMLIKDPRRRATPEAMLNHKWIRANGVASDKHFIDSEVITRLRNFAELNSLKKEVVKRAVKCLPEEEIAGLKELFHAIDIDKDGTVSLSEMSSALQKKGFVMSDFELESLLKLTDMNGNGVIDYEEFIAALVHRTRLTRQEYLKEVFDHFDENKDGFISRDELIKALSHHKTKPDIDAIIAEIDQNDDGQISYDEFCDMMTAVDTKASSLVPGNGPGSPIKRSQSVPWATPKERSRHAEFLNSPSAHSTPGSPAKHSNGGAFNELVLPGTPTAAATAHKSAPLH